MGFYPPPAALTGYPPGGVSAAQGRLMPLAFAAHSPFAAGSCVRFPRVDVKQKRSAAVLSVTERFCFIGQGRFGCPVINELRILGI